MSDSTTSRAFFEHKYRMQDDPWDFASSDYERSRYDSIVQALAHRRYVEAFEPGCSIGVLTSRLASLCDRLYAMDISPTAVQQARSRCAQFPQVEIACGTLPCSVPAVSLDLVVFSEIGYYLQPEALQQLGRTLVGKLRPKGVLLAAHWLGRSEDHVLSGDRVHAILATLEGLELEHAERHEGFRLDRWVRL